ncbi:MAG: hypothetical protein QXU79_00030 [Candidatus Micrarchaeaceae archaeon]
MSRKKIEIEVEDVTSAENDVLNVRLNEAADGAAEGGMPRKRFWLVRARKNEDGITEPDIPPGVSWVGNTDGKWYVVVTPPSVELPGAREISFEEAARTFGNFMEISGDDVGEVWEVAE